MDKVMAQIVTKDASSLKRRDEESKAKGRSAARSGQAPPPVLRPMGSLSSIPGKTRGPKKVALEHNAWLVENVRHEEVEISKGEMKHAVRIRDCSGSKIKVTPKVNNVVIDGCFNTTVTVNTLVASLEVLNSEKIVLYAMGVLPSVIIDKCTGVYLYLSEQSKGVEITTGNSTEMNVSFPKKSGGGDAEMTEVPIPEQFRHRIVGSKLDTTVSELFLR